MSGERALYLDSSAIVKLAVQEPESGALRRYLRRRRPLVSSALARAEVNRALLPLGTAAVQRGHETLAVIELIRINDRLLATAGSMLPPTLPTLDAVHLATAKYIEDDLGAIVTYDKRMIDGARHAGLSVVTPT